jgi:glyoxylase-like metal-dependent hydrolase (beta-lactamase superfamily II)
MIISHPHFYTTWPDWAQTFNCPVYLTAADQDWINRATPPGVDLNLLTNQHTTLAPGVTAIIAGGHFPGSMMLHVTKPAQETPSLFHADTIFAIPTANNPDPTNPGISSFSFMWSVPNMIPMSPDAVLQVRRAMKGFKYKVCYGLMGTVRHRPELSVGLEGRVLESAKIFVKALGSKGHEILTEEAE